MRRSILVFTVGLMVLAGGSSASAETLEPSIHEDTIHDLEGVDLEQSVNQAGLRSLDVGIAASGLTGTWCGTATTSDYTASPAFAASLPQFKVIYAYPSDRPNRFNQWKDSLQADLSLILQFVSSQPGSAKAPRFDMGTSCGPEYLDIQTVALPSPRSSYINNFAKVRADVMARVNPSPGGPRDYVVIGDTLTAGGLYGLGELYAGSAAATRPDASNIHNNGGNVSVMWAADAAAPGVNPWWPEGLLHEMTHNMGGVQWTAPHTSQPAGGTNYTYSHCWDGRDVMCYQDGPAMGHAYSTTVCAGSSSAMPQPYDCDQDDYFNPAPKSGSYLDTHWNVYNSVFMADCSALPANACLDSSNVPFNTDKPAITGAAKVGQSLSASTGTWNPAGAGYEYQWLRNGAAISGATSSSYTPVAADKTTKLSVRVTAVGLAGTRIQMTSDPVGPVVGAVPVNTVAPSISGTAATNSTLTGSLGTWSPAGTSYAYQWQRGATVAAAVDIPGATASTYRPGPADAGLKIQLRVTATNAEGATKAWSAMTSAIASNKPVNTVAPAISGTAAVGSTLSGSLGTWSPAGTSYAYQWQRGASVAVATDIPGATGPTYRLTAADAGLKLQLRITATNADGATKAWAPMTAAVSSNKPVNTVAPAVSGTVVTGATLTGTQGTWSPAGTSYAYQWQRGASVAVATDIPGATSPTYRVTTADRGLKIQLRVTATNADGATKAWSAMTGAAASPAASASVSAGASSAAVKSPSGATVARASVSGGGATASAASVSRRPTLRVQVRRTAAARGKLKVTVCPASAKEPCAPARTLGKHRVTIRLATTSSGVRIALSR